MLQLLMFAFINFARNVVKNGDFSDNNHKQETNVFLLSLLCCWENEAVSKLFYCSTITDCPFPSDYIITTTALLLWSNLARYKLVIIKKTILYPQQLFQVYSALAFKGRFEFRCFMFWPDSNEWWFLDIQWQQRWEIQTGDSDMCQEMMGTRNYAKTHKQSMNWYIEEWGWCERDARRSSYLSWWV